MIDLQERRILIAGGAGNIGRYIVREALAAGATVVVPSRTAERLEALERTLEPEDRARFVPLTGNLSDAHEAPRLLERAGPIHGAVASLGGWVSAPTVLGASVADLQKALDGYLLAHFAVACAVIPALRQDGGAYVMINGPLAFEPLFPGTGLVSIATAAQAMLARVLMKETAGSSVRVDEVVIYSNIGRGRDDENLVRGSDIGRSVAWLLSDRGAGVRGETVHLRSPEGTPAGV